MVSIIIPCYNISGYISKTIESILNQTDKNWEIIAVDDGSSDNTLDILHEYSKQSAQIHVLHQNNKGVSSARNLGLLHAIGEWIYFLDGDDIVANDLIYRINCQKEDVDIYLFDFLIEDNGYIKHYKQITHTKHLLENFLVNKQPIHLGSLVTKRNYINQYNIYFDENTYYGEDREFVSLLLNHNPHINHEHRFLFKYQLRSDSAMAEKKYTLRRYSSILACERIYKRSIGYPEEKKALAHLCFTIVRHYKMSQEYEIIDKTLPLLINKFIKKYVKHISWFGFGKMEFYTFLACISSYNKRILQLFVKWI